eukprot:gene9182-9348_t
MAAAGHHLYKDGRPLQQLEKHRSMVLLLLLVVPLGLFLPTGAVQAVQTSTFLAKLSAAAARLPTEMLHPMEPIPLINLVHPYKVTSVGQLLHGFQQTLDCLEQRVPQRLLLLFEGYIYEDREGGSGVLPQPLLTTDGLPKRLLQLASLAAGQQELALLYAFLYDAVSRRSMLESLGVFYMAAGGWSVVSVA